MWEWATSRSSSRRWQVWATVSAKPTWAAVMWVYELLPSFIFNAILVVVVSLLTKEPDKAITDEFDSVVKASK